MFELIKYLWSSFTLQVRRGVCARIGHVKGRVPNLTEGCRNFYDWHFMCARCGRFLNKHGEVPRRR